jgi:hypothetical protein
MCSESYLDESLKKLSSQVGKPPKSSPSQVKKDVRNLTLGFRQRIVEQRCKCKYKKWVHFSLDKIPLEITGPT